MKTLATTIFLTIVIAVASTPASAQGVWIGPGIPFQRALIQNETSLYCSLVAYGDIFGHLASGQTAYLGFGNGKKHHSFWSKVISINAGRFGDYARSDTVMIPVVALCFSDPTYRWYIGEADTVITIPGGGYSMSLNWIIHPGDIRCLNNSPCAAYATGGGSEDERLELPFPNIWSVGLNAMQFVNNSRYPLLIRTTVQFDNAARLEPGQVFYFGIRGYQAASIKIDAIDPLNNSMVGAWNGDYYGLYTGYAAQNIVLDGGSFH